MSVTDQQLYDALREAYFAGLASVSVDGHTVAFSTPQSMRARLDELEGILGIRRPRVTLARVNRSAR